MSSNSPSGSTAEMPPAENPADPSMEDILASIRRILNDDDTAPPEGDDVLTLDHSMIVAPGPGVPPTGEPLPEPAPGPVAITPPASTPSGPTENAMPPQADAVANEIPSSPAPLIAGEAASAAAASVSQLMRSLAQDRQTRVHRAGPTLEDMVVESMRPMLKSWLDENLPPLVERLVQKEIERVTAQALG